MHIAAAIIRRADEVALVLQGAEGEDRFWGVPGGVVEHDELVVEALVREVHEETGLTIQLPARLGYVRQIDSRRHERLSRHRGHGEGYHVTIWLFDVDSWSGEIGPADPDGVVHEARFVPLEDAVEWLRRTQWLEFTADYLEGRVDPGTLHFERWHADGRAEVVARLAPGLPSDTL